jgi:hypothetical protein
VIKVSRFNFNGYAFKEWVKQNKGNLRLILSGIIGIGTALLSTLPALWAVPLGGLATAVAKWLLDGFDFFVSE